MITIRGRRVAVDVAAELAQYFDRISGAKINAPSPFRYDRHPSFFVNLDSDSEFYGTWSDAGAVDDEWRSGGIVKLLAFLRGETYGETCDYLLALYADDYEMSADEAPVLAMPTLSVAGPTVRRVLDERILSDYRFRHPYFERRGISEGVQRLYGIGYDKQRNAVILPWRYPDGKLAAVKYRSTYSRVFWYEKGGAPIRDLIYGIDIAYQRNIKRAGLVEGEPDAMTLADAGILGLATGGATNWNATKRDLLIRSPIEEIVLFRDNDAAGRAWARRIIESLTAYMAVSIAAIPARYKDVNEAGVSAAASANRRARRVKTKIITVGAQ